MAVQISEEVRPSPAQLVGGIVDDVQRLVRQEIQLATQEMKQEWQKTKSAAVSMAAGLVIVTFAVLILLFTLVYIFDRFTPIPLWGCFAIVGGALAVAGAGLLLFGKQRAAQVRFPPPETVASLKENATWI